MDAVPPFAGNKAKGWGTELGEEQAVRDRELARALGCASSFFFLRFLFRPKRMLDSANSFMLEIGQYPGPVEDASLSASQS